MQRNIDSETRDTKILLIWMLFGKGVALSGGDRCVVEFLKRWVSWGNKVHVVTTEYGTEILGIEGVKAEMHALKMPLSGVFSRVSHSDVGIALSQIMLSFMCILWIPKSVRQFNPDVICATSISIPDVISAWLISRYNKTNTIVYVHHLLTPLARRIAFRGFVPSVLIRLSQILPFALIRWCGFYILAPHHVITQLTRGGYSKSRICEIEYGGSQLELIEEAKQEEAKFHACFLARINPQKGIFDLVEIWHSVCEIIPEAKLAIVGTGTKKHVKVLQERITKRKLENNIMLLGYVSEATKFSILKSSSLFVFPSYEEGFAFSIQEAISCGLPVVAYDLPAYEAYEDAVLRAPVGNKSAFAKIVLALLSNNKLRKRHSERAMKVARRFNWDKAAKRQLQIIKSVSLKIKDD